MKIYTNEELRKLTPDQLAAHIDALLDHTEALHAKRRAAQQTTTPPTAQEPAPVTTPVAKLPRKARKAVQAFDAMSEADQVAALKEMGW